MTTTYTETWLCNCGEKRDIYTRSTGSGIELRTELILRDDGTDMAIWRAETGSVCRIVARAQALSVDDASVPEMRDMLAIIIVAPPCVMAAALTSGGLSGDSTAPASATDVLPYTSARSYMRVMRMDASGLISVGPVRPMPVERVLPTATVRVLDRDDERFGRFVTTVCTPLNNRVWDITFAVHCGRLYAYNVTIRGVTESERVGMFRGVEWDVEASDLIANWIEDVPAHDPSRDADASYADACMCRVGRRNDREYLYAFGSSDWMSISLSDGRKLAAPLRDEDQYHVLFRAVDWVYSLFAGHPVSMPRHCRPRPGPVAMRVRDNWLIVGKAYGGNMRVKIV